MPQIIGFTGTREGMTTKQCAAFCEELPPSEEGDEFHHGDCIGSDVVAGVLAHDRGYWVVVHPPIDVSKRAFHRPIRGHILAPLPYLQRNRAIVRPATWMIATPHLGESSDPRSGTWATIRYARKKRIPISIVYPDGSIWKTS